MKTKFTLDQRERKCAANNKRNHDFSSMQCSNYCGKSKIVLVREWIRNSDQIREGDERENLIEVTEMNETRRGIEISSMEITDALWVFPLLGWTDSVNELFCYCRCRSSLLILACHLQLLSFWIWFNQSPESSTFFEQVSSLNSMAMNWINE